MKIKQSQLDENSKQTQGEMSIESEDKAFEALFSLEALRKTWASLRRELRQANTRDAIDWTDWALIIELTLPEIRQSIIEGEYIPARVTRIETGKSKGAYRVLSALNVCDALIYRHICDHALKIALPRKVAGAYFSRRYTPTPIGKTFEPNADPSSQFYAVWLRYNEYRSRTLLNEPYEILVIADISNYFDSIQHDLLFEYLAPLGLPRKAVGLLGRLLEAFRPDSGHSPSPRVGLPVDELDCSRELAHIFLFEHDRRITDKFGESNFVRWMDDQNVGVRNKAEGRKAVNAMTRSLAEQRLTLNSGKTTFLTPEEVVIHFQLEANDLLNSWWERLKEQGWQISSELRDELGNIWDSVYNSNTAKQGNWDKILKRFYGYATRADLPFLEDHALNDLVVFPHLADRIFVYFARRNRGTRLLSLFKTYSEAGENLFESTEHQFFESALLLDAPQEIAQSYINFAQEFALGRYPHQTFRPLGKATAILCLYWFGESANSVQRLYDKVQAPKLSKEVARTWLACVAARDPGLIEYPFSVLFGHPSDDVLRLVRFIQGLFSGEVKSLGNYKNQKPRYPLPRDFYDARAWLLLEMTSHTTDPTLISKLQNDFLSFKKLIYTQQERMVAERVSKLIEVN